MDYDYSSAVGAGVGAAAYIISMIVAIATIVFIWKVYVKAGEPGWAAIIPFYNMYVLFKITWNNGWKFLLLLIPIYNIVVMIQTYIKLAKAFGKSGGFAAGLIVLCPIFFGILAFDDSQYQGIPA